MITGCAIQYLPLGEPDAQIIDKAYFYRAQDTEIVAQNKFWTKEPQNLNDYFTTFYVAVKNITAEKMEITKSDFALLDQDGNQYDPLDVEQIEDMLLHNQLENYIISEIESSDEDSLIGYNDHRNVLEDWRRAKKNLLLESFNFGEIYPNAKRSGYLFFPKMKPANDQLTLIYRDKPFKFGR